MRCYDEGTLRTYLDGELPPVEADQVRGHLTQCGRCRDTSADLEHSKRQLANLLARAAQPPTAAHVLSRVHARLESTKRVRAVPASLLPYRWAAATAALALLALLAFSPVRLMAADILAVFRVQKFAAVTVDPTLIPGLPKPAYLGQLQFGAGEVKDSVRQVTLSEASASVDFRIRQPGNLPAGLGQQSIFLSKPVNVSYKVDLTAVRQYLDKAGAGDVQLPTSLDGATLRVDVPASIALAYGLPEGKDVRPPTGSRFLIIGESRGPIVELPDSVDVDLLRQQVLALPILPPDLAAQLRAIKDWRHTLVVPVLSGTHRDVTVAGVPGLLITNQDEGNNLLWQKDDVLYVIVSNLPEADLMRIAGSLR